MILSNNINAAGRFDIFTTTSPNSSLRIQRLCVICPIPMCPHGYKTTCHYHACGCWLYAHVHVLTELKDKACHSVECLHSGQVRSLSWPLGLVFYNEDFRSFAGSARECMIEAQQLEPIWKANALPWPHTNKDVSLQWDWPRNPYVNINLTTNTGVIFLMAVFVTHAIATMNSKPGEPPRDQNHNFHIRTPG